MLDRARTIYATEKEPLLVKGKERAVTAHHVGAPVGSRDEAEVDTTPIVGREHELDVFRTAVDAARMRTLTVLELVGEPGIGKSRLVRELRTLALGFTQLTLAGEQYASSTPFFAWRNVLRQLAGITPDRSREEAGAQLAPWVASVMPDLAPWLPLLAIPFDAEVPSTTETDGLDPAASRDRLHATVETFLERVLMMPTLLVVRGRALARRRVALPAPPSHSEARAATLARLRDHAAQRGADDRSRRAWRTDRAARARRRRTRLRSPSASRRSSRCPPRR